MGRPFAFAMNDWLTKEEIKDLIEFNSLSPDSDIEEENGNEYERELKFEDNYESNPIEEKSPDLPESILH